MAGRGSSRRTTTQKETIAALNGSWSVPVKFGRLGQSGVLSRSVIRCAAGTSITTLDIMAWAGSADESGVTVANIPDEDIAYRRTGIAITGSATAADDDYNILKDVSGAPYDVRGDIDDPTAEGGLWVSIKATGAAENVVVVLSANDVK